MSVEGKRRPGDEWGQPCDRDDERAGNQGSGGGQRQGGQTGQKGQGRGRGQGKALDDDEFIDPPENTGLGGDEDTPQW